MIEQMRPGLNLMIVHLAHENAEMQSISRNHPDHGAAWRQKDLDFVTSDTFRNMIQSHQIELVTWKQVTSAL
jgi:hypothetical protein